MVRWLRLIPWLASCSAAALVGGCASLPATHFAQLGNSASGANRGEDVLGETAEPQGERPSARGAAEQDSAPVAADRQRVRLQVGSSQTPTAPGASTAGETSPAYSSPSGHGGLGAGYGKPNTLAPEDALIAALSRLSPEHREMLRSQLLGPSVAAAGYSQPVAMEAAEAAHHRAAASPYLPGPDDESVTASGAERLPLLATEVRSAAFRATDSTENSPAATGDNSSSRAAVAAHSRPTPEARPKEEQLARVESSPRGIRPASSARKGGDSARSANEAANSETEDPSSSPEPLTPGAWRERLNETIELLERELAADPASGSSRASLEAAVRILYVLANQKDEALATIKQLPEDEQEFWRHQAHALLLALDAEGKNAAGHRAALVLREVRAAADCLANVSTLDVRNLALCESVSGYGIFKEFRSQTFRPGEPVLLYVEIENFTVEQVGDKFETSLQGYYDILDSHGTRVANVKLPPDRQLGNNRRRDYFVSYEIHLPTDLPPGQYTLHLTMEDVKGHKSSQGSLDFRIR